MFIMARKKKASSKGNRYEVNFKSDKVKKIISHLELAENRMSKQQFDSLGTKDIYYQLLHSGYIKREGDLIMGTNKLHKYVKHHHSTSFSSSCSREHSQGISKVLNLVPDSTLLRRGYSTSTDIEKSFKRYMKGEEGQAKMEAMRYQLQTDLANIDKAHLLYRQSPHSDTEAFNETLHYKKEREKCLNHLELFRDTPYLIPDMQLRFTEDEYQSFCDELREYTNLLSGQEREIYDNALYTLEHLEVGSGGITINFEIITNTYMERELYRHTVFEQLSDTPQIYLC